MIKGLQVYGLIFSTAVHSLYVGYPCFLQTPPAVPTSSHDGLSSAALTGVAVGCSVAGLMVVVAAMYAVRVLVLGRKVCARISLHRAQGKLRILVRTRK